MCKFSVKFCNDASHQIVFDKFLFSDSFFYHIDVIGMIRFRKVKEFLVVKFKCVIQFFFVVVIVQIQSNENFKGIFKMNLFDFRYRPQVQAFHHPRSPRRQGQHPPQHQRLRQRHLQLQHHQTVTSNKSTFHAQNRCSNAYFQTFHPPMLITIPG